MSLVLFGSAGIALASILRLKDIPNANAENSNLVDPDPEFDPPPTASPSSPAAFAASTGSNRIAGDLFNTIKSVFQKQLALETKSVDLKGLRSKEFDPDDPRTFPLSGFGALHPLTPSLFSSTTTQLREQRELDIRSNFLLFFKHSTRNLFPPGRGSNPSARTPFNFKSRIDTAIRMIWTFLASMERHRLILRHELPWILVDHLTKTVKQYNAGFTVWHGVKAKGEGGEGGSIPDVFGADAARRYKRLPEYQQLVVRQTAIMQSLYSTLMTGFGVPFIIQKGEDFFKVTQFPIQWEDQVKAILLVSLASLSFL
jgi:hypothetical protein